MVSAPHYSLKEIGHSIRRFRGTGVVRSIEKAGLNGVGWVGLDLVVEGWVGLG
jgi:hypothetical protein